MKEAGYFPELLDLTFDKNFCSIFALSALAHEWAKQSLLSAFAHFIFAASDLAIARSFRIFNWRFYQETQLLVHNTHVSWFRSLIIDWMALALLTILGLKFIVHKKQIVRLTFFLKFYRHTSEAGIWIQDIELHY